MPRGRLFTVSSAGVPFYFLYPGIELVTGLWGASYLVERMGAPPAAVGLLARHVSLSAFGPALRLCICLVLAAHEISLRSSLLRGGKPPQ